MYNPTNKYVTKLEKKKNTP